jgi:phenylacetate-CoA ligase
MTQINNHYARAGRDEVEQIQLERLQAVLHRVYKNVEFYRESFHKRDFFPDDILDLEGLRRIPTTGRDTLVANHPYGMFAVPLKEVIRLQSTSSVAKESIVVGFSRNDIDHWTELAARSLVSAGVESDDLVHICVDYGHYPGSLGLHYGAEKIGASVIPGANMTPEAEYEMMKDYRTTVLVTTPQRALRLARCIAERRLNMKALALRACLLVGQYWSESVRDEIQESIYAPVFDCYGHSEIISSGIAAECGERNGLHINEDHFIAEIIDPGSGEPVGPGGEGELVITTLTKEAFPLIRYRTGDMTSLNREPCKCGSCFTRMDRVHGRTDDMVFVGGVNLFPSQVERIIVDVAGIADYNPTFQLRVEGGKTGESVEVAIEIDEAIFSDELRVIKAIEEKIRGELFDALGVTAGVRFVEPGSIGDESGKRRRLVDNREVD